MPAQNGAAFLLKLGDGDSPIAYQTVAGLRTTQMTINGDAVVVTHKESGGWRDIPVSYTHLTLPTILLV